VDDRIRKIQEYVYARYVDFAKDHGELDEEEACAILEAHFAKPENESDPDCFYAGILDFELGSEQEDRKEEFFRKAKYWLERHQALSGEAWDVVDDRLADVNAFFSDEGIQVEATPLPAAPAPSAAPQYVVHEVDDHGSMVLVPAGTFLFGREKRAVALPAFYIDKYPVTNREYERFCRSTGYRFPKYWTDPRFSNPEAPVVGVSVADAQKFSRWVGKELPTEEQWEKAARGVDGRAFPWGDEADADGRACHGKDPTQGTTEPVQAHEDGAAPWGARELAGNVWEWTATSIEDGEPLQVIKGGCYNDPAELLRADLRLEVGPKEKHETIGFRCAKRA
jgi:serine/threonine-protein kinase